MTIARQDLTRLCTLLGNACAMVEDENRGVFDADTFIVLDFLTEQVAVHRGRARDLRDEIGEICERWTDLKHGMSWCGIADQLHHAQYAFYLVAFCGAAGLGKVIMPETAGVKDPVIARNLVEHGFLYLVFPYG